MAARILVVEDNEANLDLMGYLIAAYGYRLDTADSGAQALAAIAAAPPDLIVCDVQLPDISGYDIVRQIKASAVHGHLPVVAVTALAMVGDRDRILAAGFDGYIAKPITPEAFIQEIEDHLPVSLRATGPPGIQP